MFEELRPHLIELRKRLFISVLCVIVLFFVCLSFSEYILGVLTAPVKEALPEFSKKITFVELSAQPLYSVRRKVPMRIRSRFWMKPLRTMLRF